MQKFKHTVCAILASILIGTLSMTQLAQLASAEGNNALKIRDDENDIICVGDAAEDAKSDYVLTKDEMDLFANVKEDFASKLNSKEFSLPEEEELKCTENKIKELLPFEPIAGYVITTTGNLNVRTAPSMDSQIIGSIEYGQMIELIDEIDDWYVISFGDYEQAYILKEYVTTSYEEARTVLLLTVMYETGIVSTDGDGVNVRSGPDTEGTVILDVMEDGEWVTIIDRVNGIWTKVYYGADYNVGYIRSDFINIGGMVSRNKVANDRAQRINQIAQDGIFSFDGTYVNCRVMPSETSEIIGTFANHDKCQILAQGSEWTKIAFGENKTEGYVKSEFVMTQEEYDEISRIAAEKAAQETARKNAKNKQKASKKAAANYVAHGAGGSNPAPSSKGQAIVNNAAKFLGVRYVYGGTTPSGFDCSGLVQYACRQAGISVNRTSRAQYSNGVAVSKSNLQPGDLVFFSHGSGISHVGIYAGGGQVIHSPRPGKSVCYVALSTMCSYSTYVGARRVY